MNAYRQVVRIEETADHPLVERTSRRCVEWMKSVTTEQVSEHAKLFTSIVQFLNLFYRKTGQWDQLREVSEMALREYWKHEVWPLAVQMLDTLVKCYVESGDVASARIMERRLLNDVPLGEFPAGYQWQLHAKVVMHRLERADYESAQELLDSMSCEVRDTGHDRSLIDVLQADIYYRQGKLVEAARLYDELIAGATAGATATGDVGFFRKRYAEIRKKADRDGVALDLPADSEA